MGFFTHGGTPDIQSSVLVVSFFYDLENTDCGLAERPKKGLGKSSIFWLKTDGILV